MLESYSANKLGFVENRVPADQIVACCAFHPLPPPALGRLSATLPAFVRRLQRTLGLVRDVWASAEADLAHFLVLSKKENVMPLVTIKGIEGVFTAEEKQKAIRAVHDAMVSVEGKNMEGVTWVIFEEVKSGDWSIGGHCLTAADVKKLQAGD